MLTNYDSRIAINPKVKYLFSGECKKYYREYYKLPPTVRITDNMLLISMIQHYLDRKLEENEYK